MVNRKTDKTKNKLRAFTALVLALVFIAITAVQAFHGHNNALNKDSSDDTEYVSANEKCSICDYVVHKQSHHATISYPPVVLVPVTKAVTLVSNPIAGVYKFTLQGFTNKGPPAAVC